MQRPPQRGARHVQCAVPTEHAQTAVSISAKTSLVRRRSSGRDWSGAPTSLAAMHACRVVFRPSSSPPAQLSDVLSCPVNVTTHGAKVAKHVSDQVRRRMPNVVIWRRLRLVPTFHELQRLSENVRGARRRAYGAYGTVCLRDSVHGGGGWFPCGPRESLGSAIVCRCVVTSLPRIRDGLARRVGQISSFVVWQVCRVFGRSILTRREQLIGQLQYHQEPRKNNENVEDVERPFRCLLVKEGGQTCGLTFETWRGLTSHQRRPSGGARTVFDIWLRFSLSPTRVYCVARPARASGQRVIISSVQSDINDASST